MADFTAYRVALLATDYPDKYDALVLALEAFATELEDGRQGQASLVANVARYILASGGLTQALAANGFRITGLPAPAAGSDPATKTYADGLAFAAVLPAQTGHGGQIITTDGATASWTADYAKLAGLSTQDFYCTTAPRGTATKQAASTEFVADATRTGNAAGFFMATF